MVISPYSESFMGNIYSQFYQNNKKTSGDECDFDNRLPSGVKALVDERRWSFAEFISRGALSGSIYQGIEQTNNNDDTSITSSEV